MEYQDLIKNIKILLADDDEDYLMMTNEFLKQIGYNVDCASDGKEAVNKLKSGNYQIALLDFFMPELNGGEVIEEIRKENKELVIILQTGFSGQKPPIETMQKLNIQNYFDKTEGIDRLNLELISAVKIFNQQNEIELSKYKTMVIGKLMDNIAEEIKSDLLSIGAGIEVTNLMISTNDINNKEDVEKLKEYYERNKKSLEKIDKLLNALVCETKGEYDVLSNIDIVELIKLIINSEAKKKQINFVVNTSLKSSTYITGTINQAVFIICELLKELIDISPSSSTIEFTFTEDDQKWIFLISSNDISTLKKKTLLVINRIVSSMINTTLYVKDNKLELDILKKFN